MKNITSTQEDYLRAIYLLASETQNPVKVTAIVAKLKLSKSTVAQRLKDLVTKGWIEHKKYGPVILTEQGLKIAGNLTYKHRVIELFLSEILGIPEAEVHDEAHELEHALSDKVIHKIANLLNNPTHGPHGKEIPKFRD
jgi:DtxR family Mn-dependent transcriptional regulator